MRRRPSSRLLVLDQNERVLLFRFAHQEGELAGRVYWATPGGAVEAGETFEEAARRELFEETGITIGTVGQSVAEYEFVLQKPDGEYVIAEERFFLVRTASAALSQDYWTPLELEIMTDYRWWSIAELSATCEVVFPENLVSLLVGIQGYHQPYHQPGL